MDGLTREPFSTFWLEFAKSFLGKDKVYLTINPSQIMESDQLNAVGRVLMHGYVLCGYLPYLFNASIMYLILVGHEPSKKIRCGTIHCWT